MNNLTKKLCILTVAFLTIFLSIQQEVVSQIQIYCWGCPETDICGRVPGSMCCWDSIDGGRWHPCPEPKPE